MASVTVDDVQLYTSAIQPKSRDKVCARYLYLNGCFPDGTAVQALWLDWQSTSHSSLAVNQERMGAAQYRYFVERTTFPLVYAQASE